jgi:hypothetical protein
MRERNILGQLGHSHAASSTAAKPNQAKAGAMNSWPAAHRCLVQARQ